MSIGAGLFLLWFNSFESIPARGTLGGIFLIGSGFLAALWRRSSAFELMWGLGLGLFSYVVCLEFFFRAAGLLGYPLEQNPYLRLNALSDPATFVVILVVGSFVGILAWALCRFVAGARR